MQFTWWHLNTIRCANNTRNLEMSQHNQQLIHDILHMSSLKCENGAASTSVGAVAAGVLFFRRSFYGFLWHFIWCIRQGFLANRCDLSNSHCFQTANDWWWWFYYFVERYTLTQHLFVVETLSVAWFLMCTPLFEIQKANGKTRNWVCKPKSQLLKVFDSLMQSFQLQKPENWYCTISEEKRWQNGITVC